MPAVHGIAGIGYQIGPAAPQTPAFIAAEDQLQGGGIAPDGRHLIEILGVIEDIERSAVVGEEFGHEMGDGAIGFSGGLTGLEDIAHFLEQGHIAVALVGFLHQGLELFIGRHVISLPFPSAPSDPGPR